MPIVKILKSSRNFFAVDYNEKRRIKGEADLVKATGFSSVSDMIGYQEYLNIWSSKNKNIKNSQFHATISLENEELSKDELIDLSEKWLLEMGYKDIPYLIYYHHNTKHKHVHIITSRVDKNGQKVNDSFENERAVKCLNRLLNNSVGKETRKQLADLLHYSYSTKFQFLELLKSSGFKASFSEDKIFCSKGGIKMSLPLELIEFCSNRYKREIDATNKKKIQGLIYKYAARLSKDNFIPFMRNKFGLEFIFYGKKGDINGYTIIDFKNNAVYKGSELFGAKKISELFDIENKLSDLDLIISEIFDNHPLCDYIELKSILQQSYFYDLDDKLNIVDSFTGEQVGKLNNEFIQKLNYNKKLHLYVERFKPYNDELATLVGRLAKVKASDVKRLSTYEKPTEDKLEVYNRILNDALMNDVSLKDYLEMNHLTLIMTSNNYYLLDYVSGCSVSGDDLQVNFEAIKNKLESSDNVSSQNNVICDEPEEIVSFIFSSSMLDISGLFYSGAVGGANNKKKKKKIQ